MDYPTFSPRHVGDNVTSSRTLQKDGVCVFNIQPDKLETLQERGLPLIFDMEIKDELGNKWRHVYYAHADDLWMALDYYRLTSSQTLPMQPIYAVGVNPHNGQVHCTDYSNCGYSKQSVLFELMPMTPEMYVRQQCKINDVPANQAENQRGRAVAQLKATSPDIKVEIWQILANDSTTPELKILPYLRLLEAAGADIDAAFGDEQRTALHEAARVDRPLVLHWLLEQGVDTEAKDTQGMTPLAHAVDLALVRNTACLLDAEADADARDFQNRPIIWRTLSSAYQSAETRRTVVQMLMGCETTIAAGKVDMRTMLSERCEAEELVSVLTSYCLPLRDMLHISQNFREFHPAQARILNVVIQDWMYNRADLYRRIWRERNMQALETMLQGDAVELVQGEICKSSQLLRKMRFRNNGCTLYQQVCKDVDCGYTSEESVRMIRAYYSQL